MRFRLQSVIHKLEEAGGARRSRAILAFVFMLLVGGIYTLCNYHNFKNPEAMDAAQLARNLAEGKGYTTLFIRPLSLYLVGQKNQLTESPAPAGQLPDYDRLRTAHPDISNPPVYPMFLAGLMKVIHFDYATMSHQRFWSHNGHFWRYQPDFVIALANEAVFLVVVALTFFWARRLFDTGIAWLAAGVLFGSEVLWKFNVSGLSTTLLMLIFMGLVWCLTLWEEKLEDPRARARTLFVLAAAAGLLVGVGGLTRYALGFLIIPVVVFFLILGGSRRVIFGSLAFIAFAVVMAPWLMRNYAISGTAFGTATYTAMESTSVFPGDRLQRSLSPDLRFILSVMWAKWFSNSRLLLPSVISSLGGGWIAGFFFAGLLVSFRKGVIRRLRFFTLAALALLFLVQGFARTQLSVETPEINSENLVVLLVPLVVVYGASFFFLLLDQIAPPGHTARYLVIGLFGLFACLPMLLSLLPPWSGPVAYPPYHPPVIQQSAGWLKDDELMMSDIPWGVAWYGHRQSVWLTLNATPDPNNPTSQENFFTIDYYRKRISALYLTPETLDSRFVTDWIRAGEQSWGEFIINTIVRNEVPPDFPLRQMPNGYLPEQLFLSDWKRWQ